LTINRVRVFVEFYFNALQLKNKDRSMSVETYTEHRIHWILDGGGFPQFTSETINPEEPIVIRDGCAPAVGFFFSQRTATNYNGEILRGERKETTGITYIDARVYSLSEIQLAYPREPIIEQMEKRSIQYAAFTRGQVFDLLNPDDSVISVQKQRIIYPEVKDLTYKIFYQQR